MKAITASEIKGPQIKAGLNSSFSFTPGTDSRPFIKSSESSC